MTIAKDVSAKLAVAAVAVAMVFGAFATSAKAETTTDLQKMINDLLAQVATLQSQLGQGAATGAAVCPYTWTRDLNTGATGADVKMLQQFLNADADTRVAATGAGSAGMETETYGPATAAAVSKFQVKYRADILSPANLVNPTGYFGPGTRAKANGLCVAAPTTPAGDDDATTDDEDDNGSATLSGEADLDEYTADDADDTSLNEGDEDAEVGIFTVTFADGDASISRLDVALTNDDTATPWNTFDSVSLWVDGDKVAEKDASSKGDYLGDEDNGIIRFSGLDIVAMEDEDVEITVAVTVQNGLDTEALDPTVWTVTTESMRFFDADGVATTDENLVDDETATFTIDEAGTNDTADIKKNTNNPDAATLKVDDGTAKESYDVLVFNIDVDEDSSALEVGNAYVDVTVTNPLGAADITAADVISKVYLTIDGEEIKGSATDLLGTEDADLTDDGEIDHVIADTESNTVRYEFDFDGYELAADDVYEAVVNIEFKGQNDGANYENGVTIEASVASDDAEDEWDVDGADSNDVLDGSQTGKVQTLATVVPDISDVTSDTDKTDDNTVGTVSFQFTVGADGDDVVLDVADKADVDGATDDVMFTITGTDTTIAVAAMTLVSGDATATAGGWTIADGDEATFALDVTFTTVDSGDNGTYRVTLDSVGGVDVDETSSGVALSHS